MERLKLIGEKHGCIVQRINYTFIGGQVTGFSFLTMKRGEKTWYDNDEIITVEPVHTRSGKRWKLSAKDGIFYNRYFTAKELCEKVDQILENFTYTVSWRGENNSITYRQDFTDLVEARNSVEWLKECNAHFIDLNIAQNYYQFTQI